MPIRPLTISFRVPSSLIMSNSFGSGEFQGDHALAHCYGPGVTLTSHRPRFFDGTKFIYLHWPRMSTKTTPSDEDPRESPQDDPRQKTDWPNTKQTDEPWEGFTEKEQRNDSAIDLEKLHDTNTH